jgi:hypothetical protein
VNFLQGLDVSDAFVFAALYPGLDPALLEMSPDEG